MGNEERRLRPRRLECLGFAVGKNMYMELRGGTPVVQGRNEIALAGVIVSCDDETVTIRLSRDCLATLSEQPIGREMTTENQQ